LAFQVVISANVQRRLDSFELGVAHQIRRHIDILSRNTRALSEPAHALMPQMQMFDFDFTFQDMEYRITLFFKYAADEETIHIEDMDVMTI
jgi:hypothetical protein